MKIALESMAVEMPEVAGHPNRTAFEGVLATVDTPSQRSPSGAKGHLVLLTKKAADAALPSLLGMALDYAPSFDRHDVRRKVGVITRAEIVGRNLEVGGYLYAKDFPEIVSEIARWGRRRAESSLRALGTELHSLASEIRNSYEQGRWSMWRRWIRTSLPRPARETTLGASLGGVTLTAWAGGDGAPGSLSAGAALGMSYEVTDVRLVDTRSRVWILTGVTFTGAAILRRDKAAYEGTWIELVSQ